MITMKMAWCSFRPDDLYLILKLEFVYLSFTRWKSQLFCPDKLVGMSRIYKDIQQIHYKERIRTRKENHAWKTTATAWYFTILWLASLRSIWCSFVSRFLRRELKTQQIGKKTGEFFNDIKISKNRCWYLQTRVIWVGSLCGSASWVV